MFATDSIHEARRVRPIPQQTAYRRRKAAVSAGEREKKAFMHAMTTLLSMSRSMAPSWIEQWRWRARMDSVTASTSVTLMYRGWCATEKNPAQEPGPPSARPSRPGRRRSSAAAMGGATARARRLERAEASSTRSNRAARLGTGAPSARARDPSGSRTGGEGTASRRAAPGSTRRPSQKNRCKALKGTLREEEHAAVERAFSAATRESMRWGGRRINSHCLQHETQYGERRPAGDGPL